MDIGKTIKIHENFPKPIPMEKFFPKENEPQPMIPFKIPEKVPVSR